MKSRSLATGRIKIFLHLLAWIILLGLPLYFNKRWQVGNDFIWLYYINTLIAGSIFYINYLLLLPKLFFRNKRIWYFFSALLVLLAFYYVSDRSNKLVFEYITSRQNTEEVRRSESGEQGRPQSEAQGRPQSEAQGRSESQEIRRPESQELKRSDSGEQGRPQSEAQGRPESEALGRPESQELRRPQSVEQGRQETVEQGRPESGETRRAPDDRRRTGPPGSGRFAGPPPFRQMHAFNYTFSSLFMLFFSMGLRILERQSRIEKLQKEMEKERLNSELAFLKNQVSPHFFFNTLNNIYALIGINAEDSQKAVLKLSKLMRYLLYDSEKGDTKLSQEIDFMYNYIDLMKLRMNKKIDLTVSFPEKYQDVNFPPLLFIPFIENAFKHGVSYRKKSFIRIAMIIKESLLQFNCSNSIVNQVEERKEEPSGIGLENVTKRLNLLFPGRHELHIDQSAEVYEVSLKISMRS